MKHHSKLLAVLSVLPLSIGACAMEDDGLDEEVGSEQQALDNSVSLDEPRDFPRGSKVVMDPSYEQDLVESGSLTGAIAAGAPTIVYMNRDGGTFSPGQNDASTNRTTLAPQTVNFPAANMSDSQWGQVMSCVTAQFSRFNVQITDVDPGATQHYESVVSGSPGLLGMPNGVGGVSPFTSNCDMIPSSIVFTFTDVLPNDPQIVCEVAAQEIAHSFGLDHEFLCSDPMTYLSGCGAKSFQDVAAPCGESSARACAQAGQYDCGYNEQNSVALLTARLGLNEGGPDTDLATISSPLDGDTVAVGFDVSVDVAAAERVEFLIDGISVSSLTSGPFLFSTPSNLSEGTHVLEIVATVSGNSITDSISVNVIQNDDGEDGNGGSDGSGDGTGPNGEVTPQVIGGCSAGGGGLGDSAMLVLLGLALLVLRRRETHR